ncbi:MAG: ParB/RepB/Spo0J family partition protein [Defluviitaleaceae bacterium]|nr:ParB/RepB/Spo0J family partition protein [Defluviitaleaceae bacterium]MCL2836476.1 ParB/RepB/Spo0J family partition protein [Defluviitaleaceae bacterium]
MAVKKGLGRGIDALIQRPADEPQGNVLEIDINRIEPNRDQPRRVFDKDGLDELAESIRVYGVISPVVVVKDGDYYTIVAGERRWRAARLAGLAVLPVIVKELDAKETLEVALIENLQRADLNPVEEALSYRKLADGFGMTQEDIAARIGKSRSAVANALRLLNLAEPVREMLETGALSAGHAKVLLGTPDERAQIRLAEEASNSGLSVRELEDAVREAKNYSTTKDTKEHKKNPSSPNVYAGLERELTGALAARTRIRPNKSGDSGKIEIEFATKDELDRLYLALRNK